MMAITINNITYTSRAESNATLIEIPVEGQTPLAESQASIDERSYQLSERNGANAYIIPTDKDKVYLNFIAQKVYVTDQALYEVLQPEFEYFLEEVDPIPDVFILNDGIIFRCVSANSLPVNKEDANYFIMMNGAAKPIPNYKTLEVMLVERGQSLLSVRVLEKKQCDEMPQDPIPVPDKTPAWKEDYEDFTSLEKLKELEENAEEAEAIADAAKASADAQIAAVKEQAAAAKAEAEAAKAEAEAAKAASDAAIAEANAAQAAAEAGE